MAEHNPEELFDSFEGMDAVSQQQLLELTDIPHHPAPGRPAVRRIQQKTREKLHLRTPHGRRKQSARWAIGVACTVMLLATLTPNPVSAALQRVFSFIPGFGLPLTTPANPAELYVLTSPITKELDGSTITIDALAITSNSILLKMTGLHTGFLHQVEFINAKGIHYKLQGSQSYGGDGEWSAELSYAGSVSDYHSGQLLLGDRTQLSVPVSLTPSVSANNLSALGPTDSRNGVTMAAVATRTDTGVRVNLVSMHGKYNIYDYGIDGIMPNLPHTTVTDVSGKSYTIHGVFQFAPTDEFTFTPSRGATQFHVAVPEITATYDDSARVMLPVPATGQETVNKTIMLAGFPVTITKVERIDNGPQAELRAYLDLHGSVAAGQSLLQFTPDASSFDGKLDERTGAYQWVEVPIQSGQHEVGFTLTRPLVVIRGPWTFDVTISPTPRP